MGNRKNVDVAFQRARALFSLLVLGTFCSEGTFFAKNLAHFAAFFFNQQDFPFLKWLRGFGHKLWPERLYSTSSLFSQLWEFKAGQKIWEGFGIQRIFARILVNYFGRPNFFPLNFFLPLTGFCARFLSGKHFGFSHTLSFRTEQNLMRRGEGKKVSPHDLGGCGVYTPGFYKALLRIFSPGVRVHFFGTLPWETLGFLTPGFPPRETL